MTGESSKPAVPAKGAVFLSYASEDTDAAERIATALQAAGIQVWFDRSELRGGDAWDHQIREQIHACRLFLPVISAHTEARDEGYFRREWRLAVDRTHDMADDRAFLVPVAIDGTSERSARVPDPFKHVQWTRLQNGDSTPAFVERVRLLASSAAVSATTSSSPGTLPISPVPVRQPGRPRLALWVTGAVLAALAYIAVDRFLVSGPSPPPTRPGMPPEQAATAGPVTAAAFNPPPHSIAVLPFVNMSGDKDQEYFSDGLTEELLNSLSRIEELHVAARTSAFSFKGKDIDIATIAHRLNVGAVLEGSVRRSAHTVRVTAQLIDPVTGFHMWSQTYDRSPGDVLQMQSEIAGAVAAALKLNLLGDLPAKIELGGTRDAGAFDAYLLATKSFRDRHARNGIDGAIANYTKAIDADPNYALAYAGRSIAFAYFASDYATGSSVRAYSDKAEADARKAIALAPDLGLAHLALGNAFETALSFGPARTEYERAIALEPGNAAIQEFYGFLAVCVGDVEQGLRALRRAVTLDPLSSGAQNSLGLGLRLARRYQEALEVLKRAQALSPQDSSIAVNLGISQYNLGDYQGALTSCEQQDDNPFLLMCSAMVYAKLGKRADAEAALKKIRPSEGVADVLYSWIFAQWGETSRALDSLETAMRQRSPYLEELKMVGAYDPIRKEPRFQAIERELKFPD
jgi:TolB-like protein/Flp pilus assembly protein TadD